MTIGNIKQLDSCVLHSQRISVSNGDVIKHSTLLAEKLHSIDNTQRVLRLGVTKGNITPTMNKQGTLFMGMPKMAMPMKPGYIRSLAHEQRGINNPIKYQGGPVYNPPNKHGNTFQGMPKGAVSTRPGFIRSLADERLGINNLVKYQGGPVYNPLNKHGNTFQGIPKSVVSTQPGFIRSLADERSGNNNLVKYQGGPIYNPLNRHGNTFQGFYATVKNGPEAERDVSKRNSIDEGFDDHIFENYTLFPEKNEAEVNVAPADHDGDVKPLTFKDNRPYYQIAYLDVN